MSQKVKLRIDCLYIVVSVFCVNILVTGAFEYYTKKPDFLKTCKIYEPEFTKCSTESVQGLMTHLIKGDFQELSNNMGSLDPMKLENILFHPESSQAVTLSAVLDDVTVRGFSGMVIKESRVSKKDFNWQTKIFLPKLSLNGNYKMTGKILLIPINGSGKFTIDIDDMDILTRTKTRLYEKGGFTFYNVTMVRVELSMNGLHVNFDNIFNGNNPEVERSTNQFFNENWREFFEALRPIINETVERVLIRILKQTFDALPAKFLVEDIPTSVQLYSKNKSS